MSGLTICAGMYRLYQMETDLERERGLLETVCETCWQTTRIVQHF